MTYSNGCVPIYLLLVYGIVPISKGESYMMGKCSTMVVWRCCPFANSPCEGGQRQTSTMEPGMVI